MICIIVLTLLSLFSFIHGSQCSSTPAGVGTGLDVVVTVANQTSTGGEGLFNYTAPSIAKIVPDSNLDPNGGSTIVILGASPSLSPSPSM